MKNTQTRLCKDCTHCLWVAVVDDLNPFCNNPLTKELEHPVGFLTNDARACEYFEEIQREGEDGAQVKAIALPFYILNGKAIVNT